MLLKAENLSKLYNRHQPDEVTALADVSLEVYGGEVVALKGPSGSGKTTLLSLLGCMARPTSGLVTFSGREVSRLPERFLAEIRREHFGFIFQQFNLIRDISVLDNVLLPLVPTAQKIAAMKERGIEVLTRLEMAEKAAFKVRQLSGGEQQRVAIARALIGNPQILIADEPTAHLDRQLATELIGILDSLNRDGRTIIIATHDPFVYSHPIVRRTLEMNDGRLVSGEQQ